MSKATILRGQNGPMVIHKAGGAAVVEVTGSAKNGTTGNPGTAEHSNPTPSFDESKTNLSSKPWQPWGYNDNHPAEVVRLIRKSTVGSSGLHRLTKAIYGQRLITYKVTDYTDQGQEIMTPVIIPDWEDIKRRSNLNVVRLALNQDYSYFGICYPEIRFNGNKTKVWSIDYQKATHTRLEKMDTKGMINKTYHSGLFPNVSEDQCDKYPVIDFIRYPDQIDAIRANYTNFMYIMPQYWPDPLNDYYPEVYWYSAKDHLEIATSIPAYIKALFRNQMSLKFHIQIPLEYFEEMYKDWKTMTQDQQDDVVSELYDEIIKNLTGAENAEKAIMSFFRTGKDGKPIGQWLIDSIDDKMKNDHNLPNASAANSEVLFGMDINPAMMGQGNTGGDYTGGSNNGGSNIRESGLDMRARMQADRDITLSFFNFSRDYNGWDPAVQLGVQDMVLTTLDKGTGSQKVVS